MVLIDKIDEDTDTVTQKFQVTIDHREKIKKSDPQDKPLGVQRAINLNPHSTTAFALLLQHGIHAEHVG